MDSTLLAAVHDAGVFLISRFSSTQSLVQLGLLLLLASLLVSCRGGNGLPCFAVSGLCVTTSSIGLGIRLLSKHHDIRDIIDVLPAGALLFLFAVLFAIVLLQRGRTEALKVHFGATLSLTLCLALVANEGSMGALVLDSLSTHLAVSTGGFAVVHLLCAIGLYCDAILIGQPAVAISEKCEDLV